MNYPFYAMLSRLKYIDRWALMRNTMPENLSDHTVQVAFIAHALAVIGNKRFNKNYSPERIATLALFHDVTEILTGDMPTPIKYNNDTLKKAYKEVEAQAGERLASMLPDDLKDEIYPLILPSGNKDEMMLVKAADKLSALIKCVEEKRAGNDEFLNAEKQNLKQIKELDCAEADEFMKDFLAGFSMTLDELSNKS